MAKRKYLKIDPNDLFSINLDRTYIRPKSIKINLENRGKDFKVEYEEIFKQKQPSASQEWTNTMISNALKQIQANLSRYQKYFYYQVKTVKKGNQLMIVSDDVFGLIAAILAELIAFGIRDKEDAYNIVPLMEALVKLIAKAKIIDG